MSGKRYPEDFKIEAVRQVTDRGYKVAEVAQRLGVTVKSMHDWISKYGSNSSQQEEIRKLKAELRRVTEEHNILKEAPRTLPGSQREVRVHKRLTRSLLRRSDVLDIGY